MSKQRNFRSRNKLSFDDEGEEEGLSIKPVSKPSDKATQAKTTASSVPIPKRDSKPNLLSFDDDGEGGADIVVKKKDKDKGRSKIGRAQPLPDLPVVQQSSGAGEYTVERLKELQKNSLTFNAAQLDQIKKEASTAGVPGQSILKLSGTFKPASAPKDDRFTIDSTALVKPESFDRPSRRSTPPIPPSSMTASTTGNAAGTSPATLLPPGDTIQASVVTGEDEDDDDGVLIPDEDTIRLAKAKRERLRQAHLAPDYIPLGGVSRLLSKGQATDGEAAAAGSGSDSEADLEEDMRIKFSVKGDGKDKKAYAKSIAVTGGDEDDQEDAFAEEQLRKAIRRNQAAMPAANRAAPGVSQPGSYEQQQQQAAAMMYSDQGQQALQYAQQDAHYYSAGGDVQGSAGGALPAGAAAGVLTRSRLETIARAGSSAVAALRDGVARLTVSHKAAQTNLSRAEGMLTASTDKIVALEKDTKAASEKYIYMQQFRSYIADLLDCLQHKSALVEELEDSLAELREGRAAAARDAVQDLEEELLRPAQAAVSAALGVLGRGGALPAAQQAAESAAEAEEERIEEDACGGPDELDEFGRNINIGKRREAQERRKQRLAAINKERAALKLLAIGNATAAATQQEADWQVEDAAQAARYAGRHVEIMAAADTVFADAAEEFAGLQQVKHKLEEFKARYPRDYSNTYMHLSCPALFAPFIRLELLRWDPLYADTSRQRPAAAQQQQQQQPDNHDTHNATNGTESHGNGIASMDLGSADRDSQLMPHKGFDKQAWYDCLFDYGMPADPNQQVLPDDPDADLVPQLVRKLVLPLALHMLNKCWDPLRVPQSRAAASMVEDLLVYVPAEEPGMSDLLSEVVAKLEAAVSRAAMPPWPPLALAACNMAEAVLSRRFRISVSLLSGLSVWEGLLSRSLLCSLALDKVINKQLMPYLRTAVSSAAAQPHLAVARVEAVAQALPAEWFAGSSPSEAIQLLDLVDKLATTMEGLKDQKARLSGTVQRLVVAMQRLGEATKASRLASAYGIGV